MENVLEYLWTQLSNPKIYIGPVVIFLFIMVVGLLVEYGKFQHWLTSKKDTNDKTD